MSQVQKLRVLVIISTYLPGERAGGPVRTTSNMVEWLGDDFDFRILTSDRDAGDHSAYPDIVYRQWMRVGKADVRYLAPEEQSLRRLHEFFHAASYDILYLNGVFPTLSLKILLLNRLGLLPNKPLVVAPRGQWRPEALELKARKKRFFMAFARLIGLYNDLLWHASNEEEKRDIEHELVPANISKLQVIANLPIPITKPLFPVFHRVKTDGEAKLIFMARMVHNKGLDTLLSNLMAVKGRIFLDIYGSLEDTTYWKKCEALIEQLPENIHVNYCGVVPFDQVLDVLSQYHLFVLPTLSENFGQVILEALIAGCPVLISDRTPWKDLGTIGAGWVLALEEPDAWRIALHQMLDMDQLHFDAMCASARQYGISYQAHSQPADDLREYFLMISP